MSPGTRNLLLLILAGVLTIAASSPRTTYKIIAKPSRALAKHQSDKARQASLDRWSELLNKAEQGDVNAMSQVGRLMLGPRTERWTGIEKDSLQGEQFVRAAAALNDAAAMIETWKLDGEDPSTLQFLHTEVLRAAPDLRTLLGLSAILSSNILERCDPTLRDELGEVKRATVAIDSARAPLLIADLANFDAIFEKHCDRNAVPLIAPEL